MIAIIVLLFTGCNWTSSFTSEKTEEGVLIKENSQPVLFFQRKVKPDSGAYGRNNYIHPLFLPSGDTITEDFPDDHLHHRGIFWTWHQVWVADKRIGDPWLCEDFVWDIINQESRIREGIFILTTNTLWKSPNWTNESDLMIPLAEEITEITVFPLKNSLRIIDFQIAISSLIDNLKIGGSEDSKGYGGFSWRVRLPDDLLFYSSTGIVKPKTDAVHAGPWLHMSGRDSEMGEFGILVLSHPKNPGHPQAWILREKKSMQNAVFPGRIPVSLAVGDVISLNYRMIIYEGDASVVSPEECYINYAKNSNKK